MTTSKEVIEFAKQIKISGILSNSLFIIEQNDAQMIFSRQGAAYLIKSRNVEKEELNCLISLKLDLEHYLRLIQFFP